MLVPNRRWGAPLASLAVLLTLALASGAAAETQRFSGFVEGGLAVTGNSLGLSKFTNQNEPGTQDSIGALMGGSSETVGTFPAGTTLDWTKDQSSAVLVLPAGAEVVFAELVWGGSYEYGGEMLVGSLGSSVLLRSGADSYAAAPISETAETISTTSGAFEVRNYTRTAEVTEFVATHGAGTYTAGGIPLTKAASINTLNAGGWALYVVYEAASEPVRRVDFVAGGGFVDENQSYDREFEEYCAPASGPVSARLRVSAQEGDASRVGDQLMAGPNSATLTALAGPNNPVNNFFASQINLASGALDTSGTFGDRNHDAINGTNVNGGRQGWDVGAAEVSGIANGQEGLFTRSGTADDTYVVTGLGLEATVDAAEFAAGAGSLGASSVAVGAGTTLTVPLHNTGAVGSTDTRFKLSLPAGVELTSFAVDGNPVAATRESLAAGIEVGNVAAGATRTVTVGLGASSAGSFQLAPTWVYDFEPCAGLGTGGAADGAVLTLSATAPGGGSNGGGGSGGGGGAADTPAKLGFGKLVLNRVKGTGTIAVNVNGPGSVSASGKGLVGARKAAAKAGTVKLALKAKGKAKAALNETGRARIKVSFRFQPASGAAVTKTKTVTLLKNASVQG